MKICPKCKAVNKDTNKVCSNCGDFIPRNSDYVDNDYASTEIIKQSKRSTKQKVIINLSFVLFLIIYNIWAIAMNYVEHGSLEYYLPLVIWYIPCLIIFLFPYDKVYCHYRKSKNKPPKHLSDFILLIFRSIGVIFTIFLYIQNLNILLFTKK